MRPGGDAGFAAQTLLGGGVDVHGGRVFGGGAAAGRSLVRASVACPLLDLGGVVAGVLETLGHCVQVDVLLVSGDDGLVLQALPHLVGVPDQHSLLADEIGLVLDVDLVGVFQLLFFVVVTLLCKSGFLLLESGELRVDLGVDEIVHVLALEVLGDAVVLPLVVLQQVVVAEVDVEDTGTTLLLLDVAHELGAVGVVLVVLLPLLDTSGDEGLPCDATNRLGNVNSLENVAETASDLARGVGASLQLSGVPLCQQAVASSVPDVHQAFHGRARSLEHLNVVHVDQLLQLGLCRLLQIFGSGHIDLVDDDEDQLVREKRLDGAEESHLCVNTVSTLLTQIHKVHDRTPQMSDSGDRLHLNGVHLFKRVVQNTGGVDGLETQHLVVEVANEQTLGGEGVRLDVDVGTGDVLEERRLSNVGVSANEESAGVGVDRGQTAQMLPDLVEVEKRVLQTLADGGHATKSSALELLALKQTLTILDETHVISGDGLDQTLCGVTLAEGNAEVVGVVESVEQILVERVNVGEAREAVQDSRQLLTEGLCGVFDLAHVEGPNTSDLETRANLGGQTALGARQHNVQELLRGRHRRDILPCCLHLGATCVCVVAVREGRDVKILVRGWRRRSIIFRFAASPARLLLRQALA